MGEELAGLRREVEYQGTRGVRFPAEFQLLGIGPHRAGASMAGALAHPNARGARSNARPVGVLLLGVAGASVPGLDTGDLLLPRRYAFDASEGEPPEAITPDPSMLEQAEAAAAAAGLPANAGASVTVGHLVGQPWERQAMWDRYGADSINMEDYTVAEAARRVGVPFLSARVVLDPASQRLPAYLPGISKTRHGILTKVLAMPWRIPTMWRLKSQLELCQAVLTRFGIAYLQLEAAKERESGSGATVKAPY
jgi:hypothetical protein